MLPFSVIVSKWLFNNKPSSMKLAFSRVAAGLLLVVVAASRLP
jgi:hypothetical protein